MELSPAERQQLDGILRQPRASRFRQTRARLLLKADVGAGGPGWSDAKICEAIDLGLSTVFRARKQLVEEGVEATLKRKASPRPDKRLVDGARKARLIALACDFALGLLPGHGALDPSRYPAGICEEPEIGRVDVLAVDAARAPGVAHEGQGALPRDAEGEAASYPEVSLQQSRGEVARRKAAGTSRGWPAWAKWLQTVVSATTSTGGSVQLAAGVDTSSFGA